MAPPPSGADWTGFYAGGQLGYANVSTPAFGADADGLTYGVHAGYLYDFGTLVVGGEVEYDRADDISEPASGIALDSVTRLKLRAGYDAGAWQPYAVIGAARAETSGALVTDDDGAFAGLGLDYALSDRMRVGAEVLQHQFKDYGGSGTDIDATTLNARVSFQF